MDKPMKFETREEARLHAERNNYFWLPCPVCGEMFSGAESSNASLCKKEGVNSGMSVCTKKSCITVAEKSWEWLYKEVLE